MSFEEFVAKYKIKLNKEQKQAAASEEENILLLAVPGSGKTTTLIARVGWLIYGLGVSPSRVLAITFTKAAAKDMTNRFRAIFGEVPDGLSFRTIHSFCYQLLMDRAVKMGETMPNIETSTGFVLTKVLQPLLSEYPSEGDVKEAQTMITLIKNMRYSEGQMKSMLCCGTPSNKIFKAYENKLKAFGMIDFDDLLVIVDGLFRNDEAFLKETAKRFDFVLLDEAQDTSKIQHEIIEALSGKVGSLFMVGDDDQSIYGFRAAYPEAILSFKQRVPAAQVLVLHNNYRSCRSIIDVANRVISFNSGRFDKQMKATRKTEGKVIAPYLISRNVQYTSLVASLRKAKKETAVLYRNNDSAIPLIYYLQKHNVPFRFRDFDPSFFTSKLVRDIFHIFRFSREQKNSELFMQIYYKLGLMVSKEEALITVKNLRDKDQSLLDSLRRVKRTSPVACRKINEAKALFDMFGRISAEDALTRLFQDIRPLDKSEKEKLYIVKALIEPGDTAYDLVDKIEGLRSVLSSSVPDEKAKIFLSTIHGSKGLEFPHVIIMDVVDGIFPMQGKDVFIEEERRLFYVAITRAKESVGVLEYADCKSSFLKEAGLCKQNGKVDDGTIAVPKSVAISPGGASGAIRIKKEEGKPPVKADPSLDLSAGANVIHTKDGRGVIESNDGKYLKIRYSEESVKTYMIEICLDLGLLKNRKGK